MALLVLEQAFVPAQTAPLCAPLHVPATQSKAEDASSGSEGLIQAVSHEMVEMPIHVLKSLQEGPEGGPIRQIGIQDLLSRRAFAQCYLKGNSGAALAAIPLPC